MLSRLKAWASGGGLKSCSEQSSAERKPAQGGLKVPVFHAEIPIPRLVLIRDVHGHHLVRHVPAAAAEVAPRPQVAAPELLPQRREFLDFPTNGERSDKSVSLP